MGGGYIYQERERGPNVQIILINLLLVITLGRYEDEWRTLHVIRLKTWTYFYIPLWHLFAKNNKPKCTYISTWHYQRKRRYMHDVIFECIHYFYSIKNICNVCTDLQD